MNFSLVNIATVNSFENATSMKLVDASFGHQYICIQCKCENNNRFNLSFIELFEASRDQIVCSPNKMYIFTVNAQH